VIERRRVDIAGLQQFANVLASCLPKKVVIGLRGTLGAGKTRLVQAFAEATGIDVSLVTSPTFPIVQHYRGDRLIHHIDAYRLADEDEFIELGGEELLEEDATIFIEWPERISQCLPAEILWIDIDIGDEDDLRTIRIHSSDQEVFERIARVVR